MAVTSSKRFVLFFAAVLFVASLAACSKTDDDSSSTTTTASSDDSSGTTSGGDSSGSGTGQSSDSSACYDLTEFYAVVLSLSNGPLSAGDAPPTDEETQEFQSALDKVKGTAPAELQGDIDTIADGINKWFAALETSGSDQSTESTIDTPGLNQAAENIKKYTDDECGVSGSSD